MLAGSVAGDPFRMAGTSIRLPGYGKLPSDHEENIRAQLLTRQCGEFSSSLFLIEQLVLRQVTNLRICGSNASITVAGKCHSERDFSFEKYMSSGDHGKVIAIFERGFRVMGSNQIGGLYYYAVSYTHLTLPTRSSV